MAGRPRRRKLVWILGPLPEPEGVAQVDGPAYGATNRSDATTLASSARSAGVVSAE
jgi:hypothetical protein